MQNIHGNHFFLYAKGHYRRGVDTLIDDLRKIAAETCGLELETVSIDDVYRLCIDTTLNHMAHHAAPGAQQGLVKDLLVDIGRVRIAESLFYTAGRDPRVAIIQECLAYLSTTSIVDAGGGKGMYLGNPDPAILPLASQAR